MTSSSDRHVRSPGRLMRATAWVADGFLVLGVCAMLVLQVSAVQSALRGVVESTASDTLNGTVAIDELHGPLPFAVELRGVRVENAQGEFLAHLDRVDAQVSLPSLLTGGLRVQSVDVDALRVLAHRAEDGSINVTDLVSTSPEEPPTDEEPTGDESGFWIDLERIRVSDLRAVWADETVTPLAGDVRIDDATPDDAHATAPETPPVSLDDLRSWLDPEVPATTDDTGSEGDADDIMARVRGWRSGPPASPAVAILDGFDLDGAFALDRDGTIGANLRELDSDLAVDRLGGIDTMSVEDLRATYGADPPDESLSIHASLEHLSIGDGFDLDGLGARVPLPAADGSSNADTTEPYSARIERLAVAPSFAPAVGLGDEPPLTEELVASLTATGTLAEFGVHLDARAGSAEFDTAARGGWFDGETTLSTVVRWRELTTEITPLVDDGIQSNGSASLELDAPQSLLSGEGIRDTRATLSLAGGRQSYEAMSVDTVVGLVEWHGDRLELPNFEVDGALGKLSARGSLRPWAGKSTFQLRGEIGSDAPGHPLTDYLGGRWRPGDGEFSLDLELDRNAGSLEPAEVLATLQRMQFRLGWNIPTFRFPGIKVDKTDGELTADLSRRGAETDDPTLRGTSDGTARVGEIEIGDFRTAGTSVEMRASLQNFRPESRLSGGALRRASASVNATAETRRTTIPGVQLEGGRLDVDVSSNRGDPIWRVTSDVAARRVDSGSMRATSLQTTFTGGLDPTGVFQRDSTQWTGLALGSSTLSVSAATLGAGGANLSNTSITADASGTVDAIDATIEGDVARVSAAGSHYRDARLDLGIKRGRTLLLDASTTPAVEGSDTNEESDAPPELAVGLDTTLNDDWTGAQISRLQFSRGKIRWRVTERASASWANRQYSVSNLRLRRANQSIELAGDYDGESMSADVNIRKLALDELHELTGIDTLAPLDGRISMTARARGTLGAPSLALDFDGTNLVYGAYGPVGLSFEFTGDADRLDLEDLELRGARETLVTAAVSLPVTLNLLGSNVVQLDETRSFEVRLDIPSVSVSDLAKLADLEASVPVTGKLEATARGSGRLSEPDLDIDVAGSELVYTQMSEFDDRDETSIRNMRFTTGLHYKPQTATPLGFTAEVGWHGQTLLTTAIRSDLPAYEWIREPPSVDTVRQTVVNNRLDASLNLGPVDVTKLPVTVLEEADAEGTIEANASMEGRLLETTASLDLDVDDFGWNRYRDIYVDVKGTLEDELLTIPTMEIEWDADMIFRANAELPVPVRSMLLGETVEDVPLNAQIQLEPLPLTKLSPFDYTFAHLQGQVAAYLDVGGTLRSPEFSARFALTDTRLSRQDRATVALQVTGRNDRVRVATVVCRNDRNVLAGRAAAPVNLDPIGIAMEGESILLEGPLEGAFNGERVPLANILPPALTRGIAEDLKGTFSIDMNVDGTWETPKPTGSLAIRGGAITLPEYGRRFRDIELKTSIDREALKVDNVQLRDENGSLKGDATINLEAFTPRTMKASLRAKDFDLTGFAAGYTAFLSGKFDVTGDMPDLTTYAFDVDVSGLEVNLPESQPRGSHPTTLDSDIVVVDRRSGGVPILDLDSLTTGGDESGSYEVTVDVDLDRRSWVRHPNGDVNFTGAIDLAVRPSLVTLSGGMDTIRGEFEFLGKNFTIPNKTDAIGFTGASPPNPRLNIEANHPIDQNVAEEIGQASSGDPRITVRVTGSANEPRLAMESDPAMTESEIIFVLMTGRPPSDAGVGEDEGVASQAVAAASGLFAGLLQQQLRGNFPVDMVRLEAGSGGLEGSRLRVGKYITTNLFVSSAYQFSGQEDEGGFETRVEYHFLPSWMVEATYGDDNTGEVNVFWDLY